MSYYCSESFQDNILVWGRYDHLKKKKEKEKKQVKKIKVPAQINRKQWRPFGSVYNKTCCQKINKGIKEKV